jgi:alpha-beta hydrolase superfamily lysophospholipase
MKDNDNSILSIVALFSLSLMLISCHGMKNPDRPIPNKNEPGFFVTVRDGIKIFVYELVPISDFKKTIYLVSGITGINHKSEKNIIELLSNNENRVVVIHPRGTGYSEGKRGDNSDLSDFVRYYVEIIKADTYYNDSNRKIIFFGHSMSCANALKVAGELQKTDGLILVNPPYKLKSAKGMSPGFGDYLKYISYYIFAPHVPVVNMAGDPSIIENESDSKESEVRSNDTLLVKYFSMHYISESKKALNAMVKFSQQADIPLLLLYGENDMIVDKVGCYEIFTAWKVQNKKYEIIKGGSHGKSTVLKGAEIILKWIESIK